MYDRETARLVLAHELAIGHYSAFRPLCTDYAVVSNSHDVQSQAPLPVAPERGQGAEERNSDKPAFVMISDPKTGRAWFQSSIGQR